MASDIEDRIKSLSGMSRDQIRELQKTIGVNPDGAAGEGTRSAYRAWLQEKERAAARQAEQAKADSARQAAQAKAEQQRAAAEAERSKAAAEAERAKAARETALAERERTKQMAQAEQARQAQEKVDLGIKAAALTTGFGGGFLISKAANKLAEKSIKSAAPALAALADEARKLTPKAKAGSAAAQRLAGVLHTFDSQKLGRLRGPAGLILGAGLITEGLGARFFASKDTNPTFKKIGNAVGAASVAAGITVIGKDLYARAAPLVRPNAAHVGVIEGARRLLEAGGITSKAAPGATTVADAAKAIAQHSKRGRGATGPTVAALRAAAKEAGIANASRMSKAAIQTALEAAKTQKAVTAAKDAALAGATYRATIAAKRAENAALRAANAAIADAAMKDFDKFGRFALKKTAGYVARYALRTLPAVSAVLATHAAASKWQETAGDSTVTRVAKTAGTWVDNFLTGGLVSVGLDLLGVTSKSEPKQAAATPQPSDAQLFVEAARASTAPLLAQQPPWAGPMSAERQSQGMRAIAEASNMTGLFAGQPEHPDVAARAIYQQVVSQFARDAAVRVPPQQPSPIIREQAPQQPAGPTGAPRGFQIQHVREAALKARLAKQ